jgi:hypothetical protein
MVRLLSGLILLLAVSQVIAGKPAVYSTGDGAIRGYDPVAYFTIGDPTRGSDAFTTTWQGTVWKFSSAENRDRFEADPAAFAPRYGGYCAYAVSKGATASTEPEAWSIVDGKLYLNYSVDIRQRWRQDTVANIKAADSNWPAVLQR